MPPRDRIIMIKRERPKRVTLPDGRTFLARYKRATRDDLPPNINFPRIYKERAAPKGKRRRKRVISYRERLYVEEHADKEVEVSAHFLKKHIN